ncbi:MAG TPA: hypothetical protein VMW17_15850 [Candidatus Binatia bacterium]|nr:hypothetical protein [Candidatus Binatia bacterium]
MNTTDLDLTEDIEQPTDCHERRRLPSSPMKCLRCGGLMLRSRRRAPERWLMEWFGVQVHPARCRDCGRRRWRAVRVERVAPAPLEQA